VLIQHSGYLLGRIQRPYFNALHAANFASNALPGLETWPLFRASHRAGLAFGLASSAKPEWIVITPIAPSEKHPWDIAYDHVRGKAPGSVVLGAMADNYIEPDLLQPGPISPPPTPPSAGLDSHYPPLSGISFSPMWHLEAGFTDFASARARTTGKGIKIAHPDTGYWPQHKSTPRNIRPEQGYNYYEKNTNVVDPGLTGLGDNPGHGTATLAILAGNTMSLTYGSQTYSGDLGGAPDAEVVPIRIGASVIHLYTQAMAQGLDHALAPNGSSPCHVVSLSHGGLPSSAWADAINRLYEAGIVVVAAAGDSYYAVITDLATHFTVYPSAFNRVITATGVTYDHKPYITNVPFAMQGCWGPNSVMEKAIGAFTPNVPWMQRGTSKGWGMNGSGTSASTPQIAAACALWLSLYKDRFRLPWQRVEACRVALFHSAATPAGGTNRGEIGWGMLDLNALLDDAEAARLAVMASTGQLGESPADEVSCAFWRLLFGIAPPKSGVEQMYETEAAQVLMRSKNPELISGFIVWQSGDPMEPSIRKTLREAFISEPSLSTTLAAYLQALN
jgi:Subtilase family